VHVDWKITGDGILAFAGGTFAVIAVLLSNRRSRINLQKQLDAEKKIREDEQSAQRRAVAASLSAEIDNFYMLRLMNRSRIFQSWEKMKSDLAAIEVFISVAGRPFTVYEASADRLGDFGQGIATGIIACYSALAAFDELQRRYERTRNQMQGGESRIVEQVVSELQLQIKQSAEQAIHLALIICKCLTQLAGTEFSSLLVAKESCAHTNTRSELVVKCNACNQVISQSDKDAQTH